jgi:hypothetical protein
VTIPYKEQVIQFLDEVDPAAKKIGAVNVIKIQDGKRKGFNGKASTPTQMPFMKHSLNGFLRIKN